MSGCKVTVQQTKTGQVLITIPRAVAKMKGFTKGTLLEWLDDEEGLYIRKIKQS